MQTFAEFYMLIAIILAYMAAALLVAAPLTWLITRTKWYDKHFCASGTVSEYTRRKYAGK